MTKDELKTGDIAIYRENGNFSVREKQPKGNTKQVGLFSRRVNATDYAFRKAVPWARIFMVSKSGTFNPVSGGQRRLVSVGETGNTSSNGSV